MNKNITSEITPEVSHREGDPVTVNLVWEKTGEKVLIGSARIRTGFKVVTDLVPQSVKTNGDGMLFVLRVFKVDRRNHLKEQFENIK